MFRIFPNKEIHLTRGDIACITVEALNDDGTNYEFKAGDIVRFKVFERRKCKSVVLEKDIEVTEASTEVDIVLTSEDSRIGDIINTYKNYWYEIELNPNTDPQTIIGYEIDEATQKPLEKIFKLLPEGGKKE